MSNFLIIFLLILVIVAIVGLTIFIIKSKGQNSNEALGALMERLNTLKEQNHELKQMMDAKLAETHRANQEQAGLTARIMQNISTESGKYIANVTEKLAKLDETNRQVVNFSAQLQNLQDILKNPKQRGILGEYFLEETLKNVLPPGSYQMQYKFKNGDIVDAVVLTKDKIIPVDSKFSLENYEKLLDAKDASSKDKWEKLFKQDLKNRIDETAKYIRPNENTMEFAFMFIPSESIYYDLLVGRVGLDSRSLIEYAFINKKVVIVSPTSFLAYLQTVLQGLKAMQIEESAKEIRANVEKLQRHIISYDEFMAKLGASLNTTVNHYNHAYKEFKKVDKDVTRVTGVDTEIEPLVIDKPNVE